ncbi:ROK family glucokinase [Kineococcus rhizosphaerae]|uniref:Glucokinase n=1 Tax=Kineococcus rhizosphaerae TaxID=559628 RepID=A0A2T0R8L4_9ACTN|nr:ROK family glucokinase [Kineococcus rhizosphaerae]PRY17492.1 glucokinase [Kineococcus rhizosphaerae]
MVEQPAQTPLPKVVPNAVGVDIGGTKIAAGVVDHRGEIVAQTRRETPASHPALIAAAVADAIAELRTTQVFGPVGVAAAGFVDAARRNVVFAPNLAWRDEPLADHLEALVAAPVVVENDANAAAWAEYRFGGGLDEQGRAVDDLVMLTLGTGLGGGIVTGGVLQRGANGAAAELGHVRAVPGGRACGCGNSGCWEQYVAGNALVRDARDLLRSGEAEGAPLLAAVGGDPENVTGPVVTRLAQAGDPGCVRLLADLGRWLGEAVASFVAMLDPEVVVIGGGVSNAGELLLGPARTSLAENLSGRTHRRPPPLRTARKGNDAGIIGAADLARV